MKMNKTLIMAGLIAGSLFTTSLAVRAQDTTNAPAVAPRPAAPRGGGNVEFLAKQLGLTDEQKDKIKPVLDEARQKQLDLRKDTTMDKTERQAKMKEIRDEMSAKFKEILTPEQFEKWQKGPAHRHPAAPATGGTNQPAAPGAASKQ
jgi:Spy/CpxP family protein refolding chaperone